MKTRKHDTHWMVGVAMMAAIVILLANTPLGMIQLPIIKATTTHIPVILGAILLGPLAGTILGCVFGICYQFSPSPTGDGERIKLPACFRSPPYCGPWACGPPRG